MLYSAPGARPTALQNRCDTPGRQCRLPFLDKFWQLIEPIENQIGHAHLGRSAIRGFSGREAAVLEQFVDRLAAAAHAEILTAVLAGDDAGIDVGLHTLEERPLGEIDQPVA